MGFRPLTGIIHIPFFHLVGVCICFRPLTGIILDEKLFGNWWQFPPPYGDYTKGVKKSVKAHEKVYKFPLPNGDHTLVSKGFEKEI